MEIKRHILAKLLEDLKEKYVTILVGARQVGKTFLLKKIEAEAKSRKLKTAFFDLEQPETLSKFNKTDAEIVAQLAGAVKMSSRPGEIPNGLRAFINRYPKARKAFVVGRNNEDQVRYRDTVVDFVALEDACLIPERI